jgi:hypothetical protein
MDALELFPPDLDLGDRRPIDGCAKPIGCRGAVSHRAPQRPRVRPPSTALMLRQLRTDLVDELDGLARSLRRIEQQAGEQAARRAG